MSPMPEVIAPMLATLVATPFDDPDWIFETKWDGFRVQAVVKGAGVKTWTRGGKDAAGYFGQFLAPSTWIRADEAIVDGEAVMLDAHDVSHFGAPEAGGRLVYAAFDLLWLDGESLLD